jgi:hypothetical protein
MTAAIRRRTNAFLVTAVVVGAAAVTSPYTAAADTKASYVLVNRASAKAVDGTPDFGTPVRLGVQLAAPSGEPV